MAKQLMVKCKHCSDWFVSPISMDEKSFASAILKNNSLQCPHCKLMSLTNKEDMKFM